MDSLSPGSVGLVVCPDPYRNTKLTLRKGSRSAVTQSKLLSDHGEGHPGHGLKTQQKNIQRVFSDVYWSVFSFYFS